MRAGCHERRPPVRPLAQSALLLPACGASHSRVLVRAITLQEPLRQHVQRWGLGCSAREGAGEAACRCKQEQTLLCRAGLHRPAAGLPLWTHVLPSLTLTDPALTPSPDPLSRQLTGKAVADLPEVSRGSTGPVLPAVAKPGVTLHLPKHRSLQGCPLHQAKD